MHRESNRYTFLFAFVVCVVCSFALAAVSQGLKEKQEMNMAFDIKKNILKVVDLKIPMPKNMGHEQMLDMYKKMIEEKVIDAQGHIVENKRPEDIQEGEAQYPLYIYKENGEVIAYCFPVIGKGLWSTLYGYFALNADVKTVRGITFYKQGETPGLGAEIEKDWFQNNFKGKKIWDERQNKLVPVQLVKGKVADLISEAQTPFYVDGISGATMTSKGVSAMIDHWLHVYEPYFKTIRR